MTVITGPFVITRKYRARTTVQTSSWRHTVTTYRSKPATNRPALPHKSVLVTQKLISGPANSNMLTCDGGWASQIVNQNKIYDWEGYARAYDKFMSQANDSAQVGLALMEAKASLAMAERRLVQFGQLFKGIITKNFRLVAKAIGNTKKSREVFRKTKGRPISETYIEWLFGWKPMIDDVQNVIEILGRDFSGSTITAKAMETSYQEYVVSSIREYRTFKGRHKISGKLVVTNPNALLASQMGLTNPASLVWEAIPFSFLVNWFIPIGKYLATWDHGLGYKFTDLIVTNHIDTHCKRVEATWTRWENDFICHRFERALPAVLPKPSFAQRLKVPTFGLMDGLSRLGTLASLAHLVFKIK